MDDYLAHHGIKGMKWGVRRFQNEDGSYTSKGKSRLKTTRKKRHKLTKSQKQMLIGMGANVALAGASLGGLYAYNKYVDKQIDERNKQRQAAYEQARRQAEDFSKRYKQYAENADRAYKRAYEAYENSYNTQSNKGANKTYSKKSTAKTKSTDREAKYKNQKIDFKTAKAKVDTMKKKVAKAQADGTLTPEMMDELQEAMAQYKVASRQVNHCIAFINASDDFLMHYGVKGMKWGVRRYTNKIKRRAKSGYATYGDYLRKHGVTANQPTMAFTGKQRAITTAAYIPAVTASVMNHVPFYKFQLPYSLAMLSLDKFNRGAIKASIKREKRTKMSEVRRYNKQHGR